MIQDSWLDPLDDDDDDDDLLLLLVGFSMKNASLNPVP